MPGTRGWFCRRRRTRANDPHAADRVRGLPVGRSGIAAGRGAAAEREGGSALFAPPAGPADLNNPASWWRYRKGADWLHPDGPGSSIAGREDWPVIHFDYRDAAAYARWAGGALPSEAQWERAARCSQTSPRTPASWAYAGGGIIRSPTAGRACSLCAIPGRTAMSASRRWAALAPMSEACAT